MTTAFPYKIQANGRGLVERFYSGAEMMDGMDVIHKNPDDKGLWTLDEKTGYLRINSNQNGLSGRYFRRDLNKRDYTIRTEVIPSATDDDNFGIMFRYQDKFHFYFIGWDGGGEYNWGMDTLRLYKVENDDYILLGSAQIGPWRGGNTYKLDVDAVGNEFVVRANGVEVIRATDDNNPYLTGAFGPCATSQAAAWKVFFIKGDFDFMVEKEFQGSVEQTNFDYATANPLSEKPVKELMKDAVQNYMLAESYVDEGTRIVDYSLSTSYLGVELFFNTAPVSKKTADENTNVHAYMLYTTTPPVTPTDFMGRAEGTYIEWTWSDATPFEDGFEILAPNGRVLATVGADSTRWVEGPLEADTVYTRKLRAYNLAGRSAEVEASARTEALPPEELPEDAEDDTIIISPPFPINLRGMVQGPTAITWYWDRVETADYYELWDAESHQLIGRETVPRFKETGLEPDSLYRRYVTATNIAGKSSNSNEAMAFTDAIAPELDVPPTPLNFHGETVDNQTIVWRWHQPEVEVPLLNEDGTARETEEVEAEREMILSTFNYRVYDLNGEVLYEAPPGVFEWVEGDLLPDTAYTHFVKIFVQMSGAFVESQRSNYAYATTFVTQDEIGEEEVEVLPWPLSDEELVCKPHEIEPKERIEAFHTGVGDNLDLKVRPAGERPKYQTGTMRRDIPEDLDGDGEPDYGEDGTGGRGPGGNTGGGGWPLGFEFDGGIGGGFDFGSHGDWPGWGPGNALGGGHGSIGHSGYDGYNPDYGLRPSKGGKTRPIKKKRPAGAIGYPGYMAGSEIGVCTVDSPRESFKYDVQIQGTEFVDIEVYDKDTFGFRFKGEGFESTRNYVNDYVGRLYAYPRTPIDFKVTAEVELEPTRFQSYYEVTADVEELVDSNVQYGTIPYADVVYSQMEFIPTTAEVFGGNGAAGWGPNTWNYDPATDSIITTQNVSWSGFYNRQFLNIRDYTIETTMSVALGTADNDFLGMSFRLQENDDTTRRFYFFGTDAGGSGLNGKWGVYKVRRSPNYTEGNRTSIKNASRLVAPAVGMADKWVRGQEYKVRIELFGPRIKVFVDDVQVVDFYDDDPLFDRGAWGPTTASQIGATYKGFVFTEGVHERVYGDTIFSSIDVMQHTTTGTASVVTDELIYDTMTTPVFDAHSRFINATGFYTSVLRISNYGVELTKPYLTAIYDALNGQSGIKVYAPTYEPQDLLYRTTEVVIEESRFTKSINPMYNSPTSLYTYDTFPQQLVDSIALGETYDITRTKYAGFHRVTAFAVNNDLEFWQITIKDVQPISLNPDVVVLKQPNLEMKAYILNQPIYYGEETFNHLSDYHSFTDAWTETDIDIRPIIPVDEDGNPYTGDMNNIIYKIVYSNPLFDVAFSDKGAKTFYKLEENEQVSGSLSTSTYLRSVEYPVLRYRVKNEKSHRFEGQTPGPLSSYYSFGELVPESLNYADAIFKIGLTSSQGEVWMALATNDIDRRRVDEELLETLNHNDLIVIGTEGEKIYRPWTGYSRWYSGSVNGLRPFYQDEDGKQDLFVPIDLDVPVNIEIESWSVDTRGSSTIQFNILNGVGNYTTFPNDTVHFWSDHLTTKSIGRKWYGPKYTVEYDIDICGTKEEEFEGKVPAPSNDPGLGGLIGKPNYTPPPGEIPEIVIGHFSIDEETGEYIDEEPIFAAMETVKGVKWETIVTSRNPNVAIKVTSEPNYSAEGGVFLPVKVKAWIINPIQVPWNPLVHNGYYYLNQKEYFLYANTKITGKFVETQGPQSIDVPYSVKVYCERLALGAIKTWQDTYRSDFKGVASLIDLDSTLGQMSLRTNAGGYYSSGTYTSENKALSAVPEYWNDISWDAITPGDSSIKVETSTMDALTGTWSSWAAVNNGEPVPSPLSDTLRYRITLNAGKEEVVTNLETNHQTETEWRSGVLNGTNASRNGIEMDNAGNTPEATWRSSVIDLGANVSELGTITWKEDLGASIGASVKVETLTSDSATGPWDGTAQPWTPLTNIQALGDGTMSGTIGSVKKRYMVIRYTLSRGHILVPDYRLQLKEGNDFVDGNVTDNTQITGNDVTLVDSMQQGTYITPPMSFGTAVLLKQVLLNSTIPAGGSLQIHTLTAPSIADFTALEANELNWKELGSGNTIMSDVNSFMKVRIKMTAGTGLASQKEISMENRAQWLEHISIFSNTRIEGDAVLINDPEFPSYIESKPFDFAEVSSWLGLMSGKELNDGTVKILTSTSNSPFIGWEPWKEVTATNIIDSSTKRYIKFRAEFTANYTVVEKQSPLELTGTFDNLQLTADGLGLTHIDPTMSGFFVSDTILFNGISAYKTIKWLATLSAGATVSISTRSSFDGVVWTSWEAVSEAGAIYSPEHPYFQYRVFIGEGSNSEPITKSIEDFEIATNIQPVYISRVLDFEGRVLSFGRANLTVTMPETGGTVKIFTTTAEDPSYLEDETLIEWVEASDQGNHSYAIMSDIGRYIRYKVETTPGTDAGGAEVLPEISLVTLVTADLGFQAYDSSTVSGLSIVIDNKEFTSPELLYVTLGAMSADKLTPKIHGITAIADIYNWHSPKVISSRTVSKVMSLMPCTPTVHSIAFSAKMNDRVTTEEYTVAMTGTLTADTHTYQLSEGTMKEIVDNHFKETNVNESNLTRKQYEVFSNISGISFSMLNGNQAHYEDGLSPVFARTSTTDIGTHFTQTKFVVDENNQVLVSPIPQQGAPIAIKDSSGQEMQHVNFYDENDNLTLWYKSCYPTDGTRKFLVDHADFDPETIEIEVDEDPTKPYTKLIKGDDYVFCNNVITFRKQYPEGTVIWFKYILKNSFIVDYNYDVAESNALVTLHKPVLNNHREVEISYETDEETAYYKATEIDLNPMRNAMSEGFIYLTDEYSPAVKLNIRFNPNMLHADGIDQTTIQVVATDRFGNPVVGDNIVISASDGKIEMKNKTTDINGIVTALYTASKNPGEVMITAEDTTSHLEARDTIHLRGIHPQPRAEIVLSAQEILPNGMDKVKITARIVDHEQQRAVQTNVLFEAPSGTTLDFNEDMTNYEGEAHNYIRITNTPDDNIITIKVTAPEFGAVGYANLLIKEVARFV